MNSETDNLATLHYPNDFMIGDLVILKTPDGPETRVIFRGYLNGEAVVFDPLSENVVYTVPPAYLSQLPPAEFHYSTASEHETTEHRTGDWA